MDRKDFSCYFGNKFGFLTVVEISGKDKHNNNLFKCKCDCGNIAFCTLGNLKNGNTKSCGCARNEYLRQVYNAEIHGESGTRLFSIWKAMKTRCLNKNAHFYKNYGGRGITICEEWLNDFMSFKKWALGNGYEKRLTIDRINNDKGYCPENCRWITMKEQANNRRTNILVTIGEETLNITQWCKKLNMSNWKFRKEYYNGL